MHSNNNLPAGLLVLEPFLGISDKLVVHLSKEILPDRTRSSRDRVFKELMLYVPTTQTPAMSFSRFFCFFFMVSIEIRTQPGLQERKSWLSFLSLNSSQRGKESREIDLDEIPSH